MDFFEAFKEYYIEAADKSVEHFESRDETEDIEIWRNHLAALEEAESIREIMHELNEISYTQSDVIDVLPDIVEKVLPGFIEALDNLERG